MGLHYCYSLLCETCHVTKDDTWLRIRKLRLNKEAGIKHRNYLFILLTLAQYLSQCSFKHCLGMRLSLHPLRFVIFKETYVTLLVFIIKNK